MRGLLSKDEAPEDTGAEMPDESGMPQASPEEQALYTEFVNNGFKLVYAGGEVKPAILTSLEGDGEPMEGLANTTVAIVARVAQAAEEAGQDLDAGLIMHAGSEILADLANLQKEAGIAELSEDEIEGAFYRAVDLYREQAQSAGKLDTAGLEEDFIALSEADEAGDPDAVLPGATEAARRLAGKAQPAEGEEEEEMPEEA